MSILSRNRKRGIFNARGMTLANVLVGMTLGSAATFGVAYVLLAANGSSNDMLTQSTIDTIHMNGLHVARSTININFALNANSNMTQLEQCFAKKGTNCTSFQTAGSQTFSDTSNDLNAIYSEKGEKCLSGSPNCPITMTTTYRFNCPSAITCDALKILVNTAYVRNGFETKFAARSTEIQVPALTLMDRGELDFTCASPSSTTGDLISQIDYVNLVAQCNQFTGLNQSTSTSKKEPLRLFATVPGTSADWQSLANKTCSNYGFTTMGLFQSDPICVTFTNPAAKITVGSNCPSTNVTWGLTGGCKATAPYTESAEVLTMVSSSPAGSAKFSCNLTTKKWELVKDTSVKCTADCTVNKDMSIAWMASTCVGGVKSGTYKHNSVTKILTDATLSNGGTGYMEYRCYDGKFIAGNGECVIAPGSGSSCAGQPIKWKNTLNLTGPCTGTAPDALDNVGIAVANTAPGYQGVYGGYCFNGSWSGLDSAVGCRPLVNYKQDCKGPWSTKIGNCNYSYGSDALDGAKIPVNTSTAGYVGTIELQCNDGEWWQGTKAVCAPATAPKCGAASVNVNLMDYDTKANIIANFSAPVSILGGYLFEATNVPGCFGSVSCILDGGGNAVWDTSPGVVNFWGSCVKK